VGTSLFKRSFEELADPIIRAGLVSETEFEADLKRLDELDFRMLSPMMWTAWGQVPGPVRVPSVEGLTVQHQVVDSAQEVICTTRL